MTIPEKTPFSTTPLKNDGLIDTEKEDEIAVVMAHEMAHAALRHSYLTYEAANRGIIVNAVEI